MACVNVTNVTVLDNPSSFSNPFQFEITFECLAELESDLEWKLVYVGSAEDQSCDQTLDSVLVGPVPKGLNKFVFQADPPTLAKIPEKDLLGVTVVLLTCSYNDQEFIRVGYYVNNEFTPESNLLEDTAALEKPSQHVAQIRRTILADKPRVTRFAITWDTPNAGSTGTENGAITGSVSDQIDENQYHHDQQGDQIEYVTDENSHYGILQEEESNMSAMSMEGEAMVA